jgi:hypothetical protein
VRCLRQAYYTGTGVPTMKALVHNYTSVDWFSPDLYRGKVVHTELSSVPHIKFVSFSNEDQTAVLPPGFVAMMDGACELGNHRRMHLNDSVVLSTEILARSLHPQVTLLHIDLAPTEVSVSTDGGLRG